MIQVDPPLRVSRLVCALNRWAGGEGEGSIARETFVNSLAKFTLLDTVKEMRPKSIDCVRALVDIALEDGNYLAESWGSVLRYISQLARLQASQSRLFLFCFRCCPLPRLVDKVSLVAVNCTSVVVLLYLHVYLGQRHAASRTKVFDSAHLL